MTELTNEDVAGGLGWEQWDGAWFRPSDDADGPAYERSALPDFLHDPAACFGPGGPWEAAVANGWDVSVGDGPCDEDMADLRCQAKIVAFGLDRAYGFAYGRSPCEAICAAFLAAKEARE